MPKRIESDALVKLFGICLSHSLIFLTLKFRAVVSFIPYLIFNVTGLENDLCSLVEQWAIAIYKQSQT